MQVAFWGGEVAIKLPEVGQEIGHAVTVMLTGGKFESKMGEDNVDTVFGVNLSVAGSMA